MDNDQTSRITSEMAERHFVSMPELNERVTSRTLEAFEVIPQFDEPVKDNGESV